MAKAEQIDLAGIYYSNLSREAITNWRSLPKYKKGHSDINYLEATEGDLARFLSTDASPYSNESSRRYQPDRIDLGQILFAEADEKLNITTNHSEPLAVLMGGGGRDTYIYETDDPNIFCNLVILDQKVRKERGVDLQMSITSFLEKYTPEQRELMLEEINSSRIRGWRLK